jgi:leucyl/phenylalanyl-tRNA--protein transferase
VSGLDPRILLRGYAAGIFPMADSRDADEIFWVEPRSRAIIPFHRFHLSHSLGKRVRRGQFTVTHDTAFAEVIHACAARDETWINADIERATIGLHAAGQAHSIECWEGQGKDRTLAGGLYGVRLGRAFFGESMFSRRTDASKVALAWLVARLRACDSTAPWEVERLTGAFVQLDVQRSDRRWARVFSGWLYKESPSLNVVEHPVYDVWVRSCAMRWPGAAEAPPSARGSSNVSSAPKSGGGSEVGTTPPNSANDTEPTPSAEPAPSAPESNAT